MVIVFLFTFILTCENFFLEKLTVLERILAALACLACIIPVYILDFAGLILAAAVILLHIARHRRNKTPDIA